MYQILKELKEEIKKMKTVDDVEKKNEYDIIKK